jgi:hypothetical protein
VSRRRGIVGREEGRGYERTLSCVGASTGFGKEVLRIISELLFHILMSRWRKAKCAIYD